MRVLWMLVGLTLPITVIAAETRQELLLACAERAAEKDLIGDARVAFMHECLVPPKDHPPFVFDSGNPKPMDQQSLRVQLGTEKESLRKKQNQTTKSSSVQTSSTTGAKPPGPTP